MKAVALIGFLLLAFNGVSDARNQRDVFTIYLTRHAEKAAQAEDPKDPPLSRCGESRAESLAIMLSDVELQRIYSTGFERTRRTALPIAESRDLPIEDYDPRELEAFANLLLNRQQDALVVGHSNTTGVLAGLLAGEKGENLSEDDFDRLYQVVVSGDESRIYLLHQAFECR